MTFETRQAYTELCAVLEYMPDEYVKKVPEKIIKIFQTEKLVDYEPNINKQNPLEKNCLSKKTMILTAMINYQYWCPNKKVKDDLYKIYLSNNDKYQKAIEEKYANDNLFENKNNMKRVEQIEKNITMIEYKESVFKIIINKIKSMFNR